MRIALFADIHANREAMEACLKHAGSQHIDQYVFLGDHIGYGADPNWVLDMVMAYYEKGAIAILGNHDEAVMKKEYSSMYDEAGDVILWTRSRMTAAHIQFISVLPLSVEKSDMLYVHAHAADPKKWEYIKSESDAKRSLSSTLSRVTFCGHLHEPGCYYQGFTGKVVPFKPVPGVDIPFGIHRRWVAVIGSVGQPRDGDPSASYSIYDKKRSTLTYYRVPYDVESAAKKIRKEGLPEWFAARLEKGA